MRAIILWAIVSLMMVLHFFLMLSVGVITTQLRTDLNLSALELSFLASSYLYIYLLLQTPAGILLDYVGARKLLTFGALVCAMGCWFFASSNSLYLCMLGRALTGAGLSFVFVSSVQLANRWFPSKYFGMMIGFVETAGMVGALVSNMILAFYIDSFGWRDSFMFAGFFAVALSISAWLVIRDYPKSAVVPAKQPLSMDRIVGNLRYIVREPQVWLNSFYIFFMYITITVFSGLWANPFLRRAYDMSLEQATFASCMILAGLGVGSPLIGALLSDNYKRGVSIFVCPIVMCVFLSIVLFIPLPFYSLVYICMFIIGVSGSSLVQSFAIVSEVAPEGMKSTSVGLTNTLCLISAVLFQPVVGWILTLLSDEVTSDGLEFYSAVDYRIALSILPVLVAISIWIGKSIQQRLRLSADIQELDPVLLDR